MSYPRCDHRHRGVLPGSSADGVASTSSTAPGCVPPHPFGMLSVGPSTTTSNGHLAPRRDKHGYNGYDPLLPYKYSPLEHSSILDRWQIPAAANGLAGVVLGEPENLGEAGTTQSKTYRLAVKRTVMSVSASLLFGLGTMLFRGKDSGLEFIAGYLVEQSLSEFKESNEHFSWKRRHLPSVSLRSGPLPAILHCSSVYLENGKRTTFRFVVCNYLQHPRLPAVSKVC